MKISYTQCDICKEKIPADIKPRSYLIEGIGVHKSVDLCIKCANEFMATMASLFNDDGIVNLTLEEMKLSIRSLNCLHKAGVKDAGGIADMTWEDLLKVRNIGKTAAMEVVEKMWRYTGILIDGAPNVAKKVEESEDCYDYTE